jgi:hypothetical protein
MISIRPFRLRLLQEIAEIESEVGTLQKHTAISEHRNDPDSMVFFVGPRYHWNPLPPSGRGLQAKILGRYTRWFELLLRSYAGHSRDFREELAEVNKFVLEAIELNGSWKGECVVDQEKAFMDKSKDQDRGKGAMEQDQQNQGGNTSMQGQLGHRDEDEELKDADADLSG